VTAGRTIAKLEALLLRVRARTVEPRGRGVAAAVGQTPAFVADAPVESREDEDDQPTLPPPPVVEVAHPPDRSVDINVVVEEADGGVGARVPESPALPLESREHLAFAPTAASQSLAGGISREPDGAPEIEHVREEEVDEEIGEEPPVSSRRPVMPEPEERLAEMAFGAEEPSPLRHAPPPESGRLPAAPAQFEASGGGTSADAELPTRELTPEAIRAELVAGAQVADFIGEAQKFAPSSFVALLDASLAL
jgi:hypothetical protein